MFDRDRRLKAGREDDCVRKMWIKSEKKKKAQSSQIQPKEDRLQHHFNSIVAIEANVITALHKK